MQTSLASYQSYIIYKYNSGISANKIAIELNCCNSSIIHILKKNNVSIRKIRNIFTTNVDNIIQKYLKGISTKKIAKELKCSDSVISRILKLNNVALREHRKWRFNQNFFHNIDTPEKAYTLGFFYGDGCNREDRGQANICVTDLEIVEKIKNALEYNGPIKTKIPQKSKHRIKGKKLQYLINLCSKQLSQDLAKQGCVQNKTFTLLFPAQNQVPTELLNHWLRGLIDADGCISVYGKKRTDYIISIVGTFYLLTGIKKLIKAKFNINSYLYQKNKHKNTYQLNINGRCQVLTMLNWIYTDSTIHLNRKYEKYLQVCHTPAIRSCFSKKRCIIT